MSDLNRDRTENGTMVMLLCPNDNISNLVNFPTHPCYCCCCDYNNHEGEYDSSKRGNFFIIKANKGRRKDIESESESER